MLVCKASTGRIIHRWCEVGRENEGCAHLLYPCAFPRTHTLQVAHQQVFAVRLALPSIVQVNAIDSKSGSHFAMNITLHNAVVILTRLLLMLREHEIAHTHLLVNCLAHHVRLHLFNHGQVIRPH